MKRISYGRQNITQEDIDAVAEVLKSDWLTQGPKIAEFEKAFADYIGVKYAVAVSNGTAALHLCTMALVQNNLGLLNDLYDQLVEICKIGKILYKQTDKAKLNDYTFTYLMKQVRRVEKPEEPKPAEPAPAE